MSIFIERDSDGVFTASLHVRQNVDLQIDAAGLSFDKVIGDLRDQLASELGAASCEWEAEIESDAVALLDSADEADVEHIASWSDAMRAVMHRVESGTATESDVMIAATAIRDRIAQIEREIASAKAAAEQPKLSAVQ